MDFDLKTWWSIAVTTVSFLGMVALALLSKTYAKREDLEKVVRKVDDLQAQVDNLPIQQQVTDLLVEMAHARGEMKELRAQMKPIEHMAQLLLEQRLNDDK
ncbi:DUF2730 family protein [Vibrio parahaemolyticus]|nr:DUF2730 family protein [Vibrio parahaemolyticus]